MTQQQIQQIIREQRGAVDAKIQSLSPKGQWEKDYYLGRRAALRDLLIEIGE